LVLFNQLLDTIQFFAFEAATILQSNGSEPKLGNMAITFNVDVRRLILIPGEEKETI